MSQQLTKLQDWSQFLNLRQASLSQWCSNTGMDARTLIRIAMRELSEESKLRQCTPESFYLALTAAAQLGLEPTGIHGEAYLVPFKNEVTLMPGYQGLVKLALQSEKVMAVWAKAVYEGDFFEMDEGSAPRLTHRPLLTAKEGRTLVAAYACAEMVHGRVVFEVLSRDEIEAIRQVSHGRNGGPWTEWYPEMAKKSAVRRLCKYLPKSSRLKMAVALDERPEQAPQIIDVAAEDAPAEAPKGNMRQRLEARADKPPAPEPES